MFVLVACEFSGTVREAFKARGHDAWSCDLRPTEIPGNHYEGDIRDVLNNNWDLMIAHPPCTYLAASGQRWNNWIPGRLEQIAEELEFVRLLMNAPIPHIAIENPVSIISSHIRPPDQTIQPYQFGHDASKRTCFWLKSLPPLTATMVIPPRMVCCGVVMDSDVCEICGGAYTPLPRWGNQSNAGNPLDLGDTHRGKLRSITYPGIADAMAEQWGIITERTLYGR